VFFSFFFFPWGWKQKGRFTVERNALCYTEVITGDWKEGTVQLMEELS
jgi:hypothetical protein